MTKSVRFFCKVRTPGAIGAFYWRAFYGFTAKDEAQAHIFGAWEPASSVLTEAEYAALPMHETHPRRAEP